jgi:uncharacterized protein YbjQ (UPF0145 family)
VKFRISVFILAAILLIAQQVFARDTRSMLSVSEALSTPNAQAKLKGIDFYFGNQKHPPVEQTMGVYKSNKKTNAFNKSDKDACEWAFLSAMLSFQQRALDEGGNAVINIKSNYKNHEVISDTEYECGAGAIMAGVAFSGTVVKLAK